MKHRSDIKIAANSAFVNDLPIVSGSLFFLFVSSIIVIISFVNPNLWSQARVTVNDAFLPILSAVRQPFDGAINMVGSATGLADLRAENARLSEENARLRDWYQKALALQVENRALQSLLNVNLEPEYQFKTARVVSDTSSSYVKSILIAAGEDDGLAVGHPVLCSKGVIGRIVEVGHNSARVLLLNDLNARLPVVVEDSNMHAILAGTNEALPVLTHMPQDTRFEEGYRLLTSGKGGMYPPGLPVGIITHVSETGVQVTPFTDINRVQYVRVITNAKHPNLHLADF